ncbi:Non-catalytic module family EXPN protein [Cristinia sonorae]|uniref:Non-catalytic module family EXPN protein n=1 Tax=Cristinia sonorae TaxID=1940300 RepID=A0A8K0XT56_9AGAR|nr:Non-catalytic module family EXPN protein [Cristinia sonorae]
MVRSVPAAFFALAATLFSGTVIASPIPEKRAAEHYGKGTWYDAGLGACGYTDSNNDLVVALPVKAYGNGENCNKYLQIKNTASGATARGRVRDKCPGCEGESIDMSPALFKELGSLDQGVLQIEWKYT